MIIDFRYHIITLVAVFLMLGLGILIGTTMVGSEAIVKQQVQLGDRLEKQLNGLRMENVKVQQRADQIEAENKMLHLFAGEVVPFAAAGQLKDIRVAVFEVGGAASQEMLDDLKTAGAVVEPVITLTNGLNVTNLLEQFRQDFGWPEKKPEDLTARLARELGRAVATGQNPALIDYLKSVGLATYSGNYNMPVTAAIIVGGTEGSEISRVSRVDLNLIDGLLQEEVRVAGVEETLDNGACIKEYQKRKITTVDNIDTPCGRIALVLALAGQPGHYGTKPSAKRLIPPFPTGGAK
ncbi:MAG: copper transporter [Bacillota bacterium]